MNISDESKDLAKQFWKDGYIVLKNFISDEQAHELEYYFLENLSNLEWIRHTEEFIEKSKIDVAVFFPERIGLQQFSGIKENRRLRELTTAILGPNWNAQECMVMFSEQGAYGQSWHQDCPPEDPSLYNLNRLLYTSDITPSMGGELVLVPGSHKRGELPAGNPLGRISKQLTIAPEKGTLVLMHGHTWHRVTPIKSGKRFSFNYRCRPEGVSRNILTTAIYRNMRYHFPSEKILVERKASLLSNLKNYLNL